jgi:hypothetical protein
MQETGFRRCWMQDVGFRRCKWSEATSRETGMHDAEDSEDARASAARRKFLEVAEFVRIRH